MTDLCDILQYRSSQRQVIGESEFPVSHNEIRQLVKRVRDAESEIKRLREELARTKRTADFNYRKGKEETKELERKADTLDAFLARLQELEESESLTTIAALDICLRMLEEK